MKGMQMREKIIQYKYLSIGIVLAILVCVAYGILQFSSGEKNISDIENKFGQAGTIAVSDLQSLPAVEFTEEKEGFLISDEQVNGLRVEYAGQEKKEEEEKKTSLSFPKDYKKPIEIKLDEERLISITDLSGEQGDYTAKTLSEEGLKKSQTLLADEASFWQKLFPPKTEDKKSYLSYESRDRRKTLLYTYLKDSATGERKLKHWTIYKNGNGIEKELYRFENARLQLDSRGNVEVFYKGKTALENQEIEAQVGKDLMARASRTLEKELGNGSLEDKGEPDVVIPAPYFIDKDGNREDIEWKIEKDTLTLDFSVDQARYPIALDPTLQFTAPGQSAGGSAITGEGSSNFGHSLTSGDFNGDGKLDLVVGAHTYSSSVGRVYIFYGDGGIPAASSNADVTITGNATSDAFGTALSSGDFNADGKTDLAVGASGYSTNTGRAYIFYNDSSIPTTAATADVTITGEATTNYFGFALSSSDFNTDGEVDLIVGAYGYSTSIGRAYIFHNDGSIPTTAATADVTITGNASGDSFGYSLAPGDFNADGGIDFVVGASGYSTSTGRAYIFHNDGSIPTTAATADVTITGEATNNSFGYSLTPGDFNADGKVDLAVGANGYSTNTGRVYIFHNDGSIPTTAGTADVTITGEATGNRIGSSLASGDFNSDGKVDLAVGGTGYTSNTGRAYIFYNDGSIPTTAATADVIITGETTVNYFGISLTSGDFNADGKTDLVVGASYYASVIGRAYIFYSQNGQLSTNRTIVGNATGDLFGFSMAPGDYNNDGLVDLVIGAPGYSTYTGRAYVFYNDGYTLPSTAATADVTITGETSGDYFGEIVVAGDFNADGEMDFAASGEVYAASTGRVYIFYNDGSIPTTAATADVKIDGGASADFFSNDLAAGDFNADGTTDLAVSADGYSTNSGRAYIFYNDGAYPASEATADVEITGTGGEFFSQDLIAGDFNADGRVDLAASADNYSSSTGRVLIYYNDGSYPTTSGTADVTITGNATGDNFGGTDWNYDGIVAGDFNADGRMDLAVGASGCSTDTGCTYIFYNDGSIPTTAATADVTITGETSLDYFGYGITAGDLNGDGRTDLVVGATGYPADAGNGRAYIFYNDGSIPTTAATADVKVTGDSSNEWVGASFTTADFNADGVNDLLVGAAGYSSSTGRIYVYEGQKNFAWKLQEVSSLRTNPNTSGEELSITGSSAGEYFGGSALATGDFNSDGLMDLAVPATFYDTDTGRVYIFYGDGNLPANASSADIIITGNASGDLFGDALVSGDFNADGRTDLAVGADEYSTVTGRVYIFYNDGSIPTTAATADVTITGEATDNNFGLALAAGDFNADGETDLAASGIGYSTGTGRVYIFYNDGTLPTTAATADVIITGAATGDVFGWGLTAGDFNGDGETDIATTATGHSTAIGRAYIFYNDGSIPTTAGTADVTITGNASNDSFGWSITSGDFNADSKVDLAVGAVGYSSNTGRVYIFHNDGSIPTTAATADVTITGETAGDELGYSVTSGDLNADGRMDLVANAPNYSSTLGRVYLFYNDGSIPTTAATADMIFAGENTADSFGYRFVAGDLNADGKTDLVISAGTYNTDYGRVYVYTFNDKVITGNATGDQFGGGGLKTGDFNSDGKVDLIVGAPEYSSQTGCVYIFYNDGTLPTTAATADVTITGETGSYFGSSITVGDFNSDGRIDFATGANNYSTSTGRAYIFYNDGTLPTTAATADVTITGNAVSDNFGIALSSGDLNFDGKVDLIVGAMVYSSYTGRAYIFYNDGSIPTTAGTADVTITGETSSRFGSGFATGDLNSDGRTDLVIFGYGYSSFTGRAYIFYNDGTLPTTAATADVTITGESVSNYFGTSFTTGDFNSDGRVDLAVGAWGYNSENGRLYIFHNDGSIPTTAATADMIITGSGGDFGFPLVGADINADGRTDLIVGSWDATSGTDHLYVFYNDGAYPSSVSGYDIISAGESATDEYTTDITAGDLNADGIQDLVVSAHLYPSGTGVGRVYIILSEAKTLQGNPPADMQVRGTAQFRGTTSIR